MSGLSVSPVLLSEDSVLVWLVASLESEVALAAFSADRWLVHQPNVADTDPPVSAISALKAVELSAGDVAVADE